MKEKRMDENTKRFVSISEKPGTSGLNFHNQGYRLLGLNCVYFPLEIHSSKLGKAIQIVKDNFDGCSVSMPHKEKVIWHLDELGESGKRTGAVNTIKKEDVDYIVEDLNEILDIVYRRE
tara:strand:- start:64 stop:420 length:357 start_codon:yes stop_codon:yes gene_type:complete